MDHEVELKFNKVKQELESTYGEGVDLQVILFLIGVNELGMGYKDFSKNEKTDLMHVAVCTLLEPYGYYEYEGKDKDNWPHFTLNSELPPLSAKEQEHLIKEAIISYFQENGYIDVRSTTA